MKQYLDILQTCLNKGTLCENRTGTPAIRYIGATFNHDMSKGFPLLTTKKMGLKNIATELEFFIKGYTDKKWLQDRGCHIWDQWANKQAWEPIYKESLAKIEFNQNVKLDEKTKENLQNNIIDATRDLGPIYGWQWNHFGGVYSWDPKNPTCNYRPSSAGINQIQAVIDQIKAEPNSRRALVTAVNPADKPKMGLEPCHLMHHILVMGDKLNLIWTQRSCDMFLGVPYNIASYALLLLLYAKELGYKPGILRGELHDVHIYENHIEPVKEQLSRKPYKLPTVEIPGEHWNGLLNWSAENGFVLKDYICHSALKGEVAR